MMVVTLLVLLILLQCDIGKPLELKINVSTLSREDKYRIITSEPHSDASTYPQTHTSASTAFRQFQPSWLKSFPWLHYSRHVDGAFCRACVIFLSEGQTLGGQRPGKFVTNAFRSWKRTDQLTDHAKRGYHLTSLTKMAEFITRYQQPSAAINIHMQVAAKQRLEDNQRVIESLFKVVLLCGMQGLALRGHRDDHIEWDEEREESGNQGNFTALVRFRAETDEILKKHLHNAPRNAKYMSKTIQNQLIDIIGQCIQMEILDEVKDAKFYSIIADEVCDVSNKEQLSLCLRYVQASSRKDHWKGAGKCNSSLSEYLGFTNV